MRHPLFISRTVLVKNNNIEEAMGLLNKLLGNEGVLADARRIQYYEKPWQNTTIVLDKTVDSKQFREEFAENYNKANAIVRTSSWQS